MSYARVIFKLTLATTLFFLCASTSWAQATRTWVSGVGDDANPCSRTAPCKTFAGAISKTAAGGVIDVLDSGGFGGVTITKSITLQAVGAVGSILVAGTNGVVVNAGPNDIVVLQGLQIEGLVGTPTPGLNGVRFLAGGALVVTDCVIKSFSQNGISFEPSTTAKLTINNTSIIGATNAAVLLVPGASATSSSASITGGRFTQSGFGVLNSNGTISIRDAMFSGNVTGLQAQGTVSARTVIDNAIISDNTNFGIRTAGPNASTFVSNSTISNNGTGVVVNSGSQIVSYGNNRVILNAVPGAFSSIIPQQ